MTTQSMLLKMSSISWAPHDYQKKAVKFLLQHAAAALFLDPGLGKTSITLAAIKLLKKRGLLNKVLLIAPLRVCHLVWPNEVIKWKDFHGLKVVVLHGKNKDDLLEEDADIYIINPEGLEWLLQVEKIKSKTGKVAVKINIKRWKKLGFDTLVIDELSKFKRTNTIRFKAMKLVLHTFARRWGLTGSPAANGLMDLFGQCYMLDQGRTLGQYITHYRRQYFDEGYDGWSWELKDGADKEIYKRLKPLALRMAAEDYIKMPKLVRNNIPVRLPPKALKTYLTLEEHLMAQIYDGVVTAGSAAVASMKCRQIAAGAIYKDQDVEALVKLPSSKREWVEVHKAKIDALEELVDELQGSPLLVSYDFKHDLERIKERFGKDVPYIGGGVNTIKAQQYEAAWNKGELPILFGHPASMGHGLNLQAGHHICVFTPIWDYELYDQFIRRVRRQGNKSSRVFLHSLIGEGTIDEVITETLTMKKNRQNALFKALKARKNR